MIHKPQISILIVNWLVKKLVLVNDVLLDYGIRWMVILVSNLSVYKELTLRGNIYFVIYYVEIDIYPFYIISLNILDKTFLFFLIF